MVNVPQENTGDMFALGYIRSRDGTKTPLTPELAAECDALCRPIFLSIQPDDAHAPSDVEVVFSPDVQPALASMAEGYNARLLADGTLRDPDPNPEM